MDSASAKVVTNCGELQELFQRAQQAKTPVYLYRDKPAGDGVLLDLSGWNQIEQFDADNLMVIVPPGLLLKDLNTAAAAQGLRFIPADTPAFADLSVGEWAYRGCPNPSAWKYGAGKHFLLGASYVFPNGEMTPVGGKCIKNVTGYDLTRFLTGPYADLAVGVQYIIKLMPLPAFRINYNVEVASLEEAVNLVRALQARPVPPAYLFWMDKAATAKLGYPAESGHRIMFELDGNEAEVRDYAQAVNDMLAGCRAEVAAGDAVLPELASLENRKNAVWLLDEFKVPYTSAVQFAAEVEGILSKAGCTGGLFGQLADGKIHLYLEQEQGGAADLVAAIQDAARSAGGVVSGKYQRLYNGGPTGKLAELEMTFKQMLDPAGIFNPFGEVAR